MLIEIRNMEKSYGKKLTVNVLKGISLDIEAGEMIAVKGPSGSGKSTLLHILGCLDKPDRGEYYLEGHNVSELTPAELARIRNKKFGFVMQNFALIDEDSVLENVKVPLMFCRNGRKNADSRTREMLKKLGITDLAKKPVKDLSGGERQRTAIARALINDPEIILADEPTGALDQANKEIVMDILKELNVLGKTVIIVTHEDFIAGSCQRIINILDGVISEER